jgi:DNA polymerase elongation subunit (family B)
MEPIETSPPDGIYTIELIANLDFASLYPRTQLAYNIGVNIRKALIRKMKIKKIFNL